MKKEGSSDAGVFAAVVGLLSIALPIANFPFGVLFGSVVGIVLGVIALVIGIKANRAGSTSWSKAGIAMGIIGIIISVLLLIWAMAFLTALAAQVEDLREQGFFENLDAAQQFQQQYEATQ